MLNRGSPLLTFYSMRESNVNCVLGLGGIWFYDPDFAQRAHMKPHARTLQAPQNNVFVIYLIVFLIYCFREFSLKHENIAVLVKISRVRLISWF